MNESKKDMENIQKNLENFLQRELENDIDTSSPDYEEIVRDAYQDNAEKEADFTENKNTESSGDRVYFKEREHIKKKSVKKETKSVEKDKKSVEKDRKSTEKDKKRVERDRKSAEKDKKRVEKNRKNAEKDKKREEKDRKNAEKDRKREEKDRKSAEKNRKRVKAELSKSSENEQSRGQRKKGKFLPVLICFLVLLGIAWYIGISGIYGKMDYEESGQLVGQSMTDKGVVNILLIGTDARSNEETGRSDAMILLSVSSKTKTVHMTSLLRDMYVEIPGHDGNRLNAAYAYGGPELLLETVSLNFDIDVNRYVLVDFQTFASLVDGVGGVELELSNEEVQWVNAYLNEYNILRNMPLETDYLDTSLSGMMHLNGAQALAYSRNRYIGSDFGRTERQRKVLGAVTDNIASAIIRNPLELIDGVFSELTTNLSKSECLQLSLMSAKLLTYDIVQGSIPLAGTYSDATIRDMAVLEVDFEKNKEYIRREIYGE